MNWERQERGWYTSSIGGVSKERIGWWFWPLVSLRKDPAGYGPFKTMKDAMAEGERLKCAG